MTHDCSFWLLKPPVTGVAKTLFTAADEARNPADAGLRARILKAFPGRGKLKEVKCNHEGAGVKGKKI